MIDSHAPVFVTGCSRSGTTALVHLLNSHPDVVIGMERFKYLYFRREPGSLHEVFTPSRFMEFRPTDTNLTPPQPRWREFYERADEKLAKDDPKIIGDKALATKGILSFLHDEYPDARWIFIFRDVVGVAGSYVRRAENPDDVTWPPTKRHQEALGDWSRAFEAVDDLTSEVGSHCIFPVCYESLFSGDKTTLTAMFAFLGCKLPDIVTKKFESMTSDWETRKSAVVPLTEQERSWLDANRPVDLEARYEKLAKTATLRWVGPSDSVGNCLRTQDPE